VLCFFMDLSRTRLFSILGSFTFFLWHSWLIVNRTLKGIIRVYLKYWFRTGPTQDGNSAIVLTSWVNPVNMHYRYLNLTTHLLSFSTKWAFGSAYYALLNKIIGNGVGHTYAFPKMSSPAILLDLRRWIVPISHFFYN